MNGEQKGLSWSQSLPPHGHRNNTLLFSNLRYYWSNKVLLSYEDIGKIGEFIFFYPYIGTALNKEQGSKIYDASL